MVIRKIEIENYLCYYGVKKFELSEGLNIILGENGEGKTKFFEAIDWLFNGDNKDLGLLVSAKKIEETEIGDSFRVKVSMNVEQYGEKNIISKSFLVKKEDVNNVSTSNFMIEGTEENNAGERTPVDGQILLDRIFPFQIRKYSMFKGESDLNIFENEAALTNLINLFSDAKHYDKYSEKGEFLREKAEKAVDDSSKLDKKNETTYRGLETEIDFLNREKNKNLVHLQSTDDEIKKIEGNLELAESYVQNADALQTINTRIKNTNEEIRRKTSLINENYTTSLFDEKWILVGFEKFHNEFVKKISSHSKKRRELQKEFDKQLGIKEGLEKAKTELINNAIPLPDSVPSREYMEEMIGEEVCKVCNREAKKGSEAYEFMMERLNKYIDSQRTEVTMDKTEEVLFLHDYTNRLENLSISHDDNLKNLRSIQNDITDSFNFNDARKKDIETLNEKLENEFSEREKILGNSSVAEEELIDVLKNYNSWQNDLKTKNQDHSIYTNKLNQIESDLKLKKAEKDKIDIKSANAFLIQTRDVLRDIESIFIDTKEKKFDEFIEKLQSKSNNFFKTINVDAFTGTIVFYRRNKVNRTIVEVELQENGRTFFKPNQSLLTSMHISILFAISELASEIKEENFPMIFDAPTSSFGENKTAQFLNLIYQTDNQKILLIKDFLHTDKSSKNLSIKSEFDNVRRDKAFWVKLERPFDPNNLTTINSQVITL